MANNILTITAASLIGGASFVESVFTVTNGATTISERHYLFSANLCSAIYDASNPNIGVLNLGTSHQVTISNGDYSTLKIGTTTYASVELLIAAYIADIAQFTT